MNVISLSMTTKALSLSAAFSASAFLHFRQMIHCLNKNVWEVTVERCVTPDLILSIICTQVAHLLGLEIRKLFSEFGNINIFLFFYMSSKLHETLLTVLTPLLLQNCTHCISWIGAARELIRLVRFSVRHILIIRYRFQ